MDLCWKMADGEERGLKHWAHRRSFELVTMSCTWVVAGLFFSSAIGFITADMQVRPGIRKVKEYFRTFRERILAMRYTSEHVLNAFNRRGKVHCQETDMWVRGM